MERAAERAASRRAARLQKQVREDEEMKVIADLLATLETKHSKAARRLGERVARRDKEYFVRKLHHELTKIVTPLEAFQKHRRMPSSA